MPIYLGNNEINTEYVDGYQLGNIFLGNQPIQETDVILASGGTITTSGSYIIHTFTSSGDFIVSQGDPDIELLVVAGGGGGGGNKYSAATYAGGGGAGGLFYTSSYALTSGIYNVTIGNGGAKSIETSPNIFWDPSGTGSNSSFGSLIALGGGNVGEGSTSGGNGGNGGSGGGSNSQLCPGTINNQCPTLTAGVALQPTSSAGGFGNNGALSGDCGQYCGFPYTARNLYRQGGGGGGAGSAGSGINGGNGLTYNFTGTSTTYAAGGDAAISGSGIAPIANTGNGGDGYQDGASGIVIVKYQKYP